MRSPICCAVRAHASRRQLFVPAELLERHGTRVEEMYGRAGERGLARGTGGCCGPTRARHLVGFELLLPVLPAAAMPAFLPLALVPGYLRGWSGTTTTRSGTPVEVAQWRRQWTLWRAARRYAGAMRGA